MELEAGVVRRAIILGILGLVVSAGLVAADVLKKDSFDVANSCAAGCRAQHNQCRIATKGSPACDAQLNQCLRSCLKH